MPTVSKAVNTMMLKACSSNGKNVVKTVELVTTMTIMMIGAIWCHDLQLQYCCTVLLLTKVLAHKVDCDRWQAICILQTHCSQSTLDAFMLDSHADSLTCRSHVPQVWESLDEQGLPQQDNHQLEAVLKIL